MSDYKNLKFEVPQDSGDFQGRIIYKEDPEQKWVPIYITIELTETIKIIDSFTGRDITDVIEEIEWREI